MTCVAMKLPGNFCFHLHLYVNLFFLFFTSFFKNTFMYTLFNGLVFTNSLKSSLFMVDNVCYHGKGTHKSYVYLSKNFEHDFFYCLTRQFKHMFGFWLRN